MIDERQRPKVGTKLEPTGEVHPVAELFPMMTDDELDALAGDIKANGLLQPIVLDENGVLIDGRNRLAACQRARVEPVFAPLNGHDPREFIGSVNDGKRRRMTQGQVAMAYVEMYWDEGLDKLSKTQEFVAQKAGVPRERIKEAAAVKKITPLVCASVRLGRKPASVAHEEALKAKAEEESDEARGARLQAESPELWEMVKEGTLSLRGALAELEERKEKKRQRVDKITRHLDTVFNHLDPRSVAVDEYASHFLEANPSLLGESADLSAARARRSAEVLLRYAELKENEENV